MLYSGGGKQKSISRHQDALTLRVSQKVIDDIVERTGQLKCTHFDAWRFFHPVAQPLNMLNPLSRSTQKVVEQPGCVHVSMDLFKYAFQLYPIVSSTLLRDTLRLALQARKIDMLASPYDVSAFVEESAIEVESVAGRERYVREQEALSLAAAPVRSRLLYIYDLLLG
jgi:hypothetical protein